MTPFHFCEYFPFEENLPLIWTNLNALYQRITCTKFDWIWLSGSREHFKNFQCIFTFLLLSPLGDGRFPSFVQIWFKLAQWFCRKSLQMDRDDGQPAMRKAHLSFQLRWAKKWNQFATAASQLPQRTLTGPRTLKDCIIRLSTPTRKAQGSQVQFWLSGLA